MTAVPVPAAPGSMPDHPDLTPTPPAGLSAAEVERRRAAGLGNTALPSTTRTYAQILRENTFTFVNDILFALGILLVAVGRPMDAIVSLAVISTNIVVGIVGEIRAKRTLDRIALLTRPTAAVVRDGVVMTIAPDDLVLGDLVEINAGDQVVLDGRLSSGAVGVDESQLTGESDVLRKRPGDGLFSGSFATTGTGRYVAEKVSTDSFANQVTAGARSFRRTITPLQAEINLVIRVVLGIVLYMEVLLVTRALLRTVTAGQEVADATLLAGLIPNGLFVSIAVAYALGAIRILRFGALVQQSNAIESLSHVDVLCLDKTGTLTANRLEVELVVPLGDATEAEVTGALADLAASATAPNKTSEAIGARWPAARRPLAGEAPFSSARKWSAVAFADDGNGTGAGARHPGIVALGAPQFLRRFLAVTGDLEGPEDVDTDPDGWDDLTARLSGLTARGLRVLLVATYADAAALPPTDDEEAIALPAGMRPLGLVALRDELRDGAAETLASFREAGVAVKVISGDDPETVLALARQAGITDATAVSGHELDALDDTALGVLAARTTVFGRITPAQKERLVDALRARGNYVAMIGDGVNDVLSLKKANLGIAMGSGTQATRGVADLVLMNDSFSAVAKAVVEGQRIRNGMQDILKLFLTRIATVGLVVISSLVVRSADFPIQLRNASALTVFTVGIPSALLAVWAQPGRRVAESLGRTLATFVVPAAVASGLGGLFVFFGSIALEGSGSQLALDSARTALTAFLVYAGLILVIFVEPPTDWWAVAEPRSPDRRPTILAVALGIGFLVTLAVPPARAFFSFEVPSPRDALLVLIAVVTWVLLVRELWLRRLIERFMGLV